MARPRLQTRGKSPALRDERFAEETALAFGEGGDPLAQRIRTALADDTDITREGDCEDRLQVVPGHRAQRLGALGEAGDGWLIGLCWTAETLAEEKLDRGDAGADVGGR